MLRPRDIRRTEQQLSKFYESKIGRAFYDMQQRRRDPKSIDLGGRIISPPFTRESEEKVADFIKGNLERAHNVYYQLYLS